VTQKSRKKVKFEIFLLYRLLFRVMA